jgi:hypothetical protein
VQAFQVNLMSFVRFRLSLSACVNLLCISLLGALCAVGSSEVPKTVNAVAPQFRTAPRSLITEKVDVSRPVTVPGAVRASVASLKDLGASSPSLVMEHMQLVLKRPAERQAAFDAAVDALHTPGASYHKWLTPETVGSEFGLSGSDVATIQAYLQGQGFTVNFTAKSGMFVDFTGTAAQVEKAFHTTIHNIQNAPGDVRYAATVEASLPEAIAPAVTGFVALSNLPSVKPLMQPKTASLASMVSKGNAPAGVRPDDTVTVDSEYNEGAQDFYTIYNVNPLLTAGINGHDVTVAVIEETDLKAYSDLTTFRAAYNVIPNTPNYFVDHGYGSITCTDPGITSADEEGEAVLDAEWASTVAPSATLLYMSCKTTTTAGIFLSAEAIIDNNLADTMSLSYGYYEAGSSSEDTLAKDLWEQAASQGETVVVSAGDSGSDAEDQNANYATHGINVSGFSSTSYNVSAGGTDFQDGYNYFYTSGASANGFPTYWAATNGTGASSALSYIPEIPWNQTCASSQVSYYFTGNGTNPNAGCENTSGKQFVATGGGSGGPSTVNARPVWQTATVYGLPSTTTYTGRLQPDISFLASAGFWGHGVDFYDSDETPSATYAGGTSFVAPQLAGMFGLLVQKTGERQGQPNYVLYAMAAKEYGTTSYTGSSCNSGGTTGYDTTDGAAPASTCIFHDIVGGNNSQACRSGTTNCFIDTGQTYGVLSTSSTTSVPGFVAGQGYDMATGLGSPNVANLINNWPNSVQGAPQTPTVTLTAGASSVPYDNTTLLTAVVSGTGSFPTGSVTFSGSSPMGTFGTSALVPSSGCTTAGTCTETATLTSGGLFPVGSVTLTATYSSLNENYTSASGSTPVTVTSGTVPATVTVTGIPSQVYGGVPYPATVTVAGGASFLGAVIMSSTDPLVNFSPQPYTYVAGDSGSHTFTVTFASSGTQSVTASAGATSGSEGSISVITDYPWVVNTKGTVVKVNEAGTALTAAVGVVGTAATNGGAAFDASGNVWSVSSVNNTLDTVTKAGAYPYAYYGGGLSGPKAVAVDGSGYIWIANSTGNTVSEFGQTGLPVSTTSGFGSSYVTGQALSGPAAIAIDNTGGVWVASKTTGSITHIVGAAAPVVTPTVTGVTNGTLGSKP